MKTTILKPRPTEFKQAKAREAIYTPEEQLLICRQIAQFNKPSEIREFCREKLGKSINISTIDWYRSSEKWQPIVKKFRDEYLLKINEIPLANKVKRLEKLTDEFEEVERLKSLQKINIQKLPFIDRELDILDRFREEMEPRLKGEYASSNYYFTQFNNMSKEEFYDFCQTQMNRIKHYQTQGGEDARSNGEKVES